VWGLKPRFKAKIGLKIHMTETREKIVVAVVDDEYQLDTIKDLFEELCDVLTEETESGAMALIKSLLKDKRQVVAFLLDEDLTGKGKGESGAAIAEEIRSHAKFKTAKVYAISTRYRDWSDRPDLNANHLISDIVPLIKAVLEGK
jgi:hypothetical protein